MAQTISIELYQLLEEKLGKEEAKKVASAIEIGLEVIEKKADAVALQKKLEIKDELTKELATKADIARLEGEIQTVRQEIQTVKADLEGKIATLRMEFRVYFVILLAVIILVSPKAIDLIGKFLGVIK
ncbi:MAG: hypothetical protein OHK0032_19100 [Thermodesulfovibrionales bacterium]